MHARYTLFFDSEARKLHDKAVFELLKTVSEEIHPTALQALLEPLDDHDLELIPSCTDWEMVAWKAERILHGRSLRSKPRHVTRRSNYRIEYVLDDFVNRRTGKVREAHRQLRERFPGLDHDMQEEVMMAFMSQGSYSDRTLICGYLYNDDEFWDDRYIPLVQQWWEAFHDAKMANVVVKRCPRDYVAKHLDELIGHCNYASLCLKVGMTPDEGRLPQRTYLFVMKSLGRKLGPRKGEETVLSWVREYLYEDGDRKIYDSIFDIPYVGRMVLYLGEMALTDDILALEAFDKRMQDLPSIEWGTDIIREIEKEFPFPEYIYKEIK